MKVKGISFVELHVEKLVLLGVVAVAGFFAATQFLIQKNTLTIDQREHAAGKIDTALIGKANDIQADLDESAQASVLPPEGGNVGEWFDQTLAGSLSPQGDRLVVILATPPIVGVGDLVDSEKAYIVPTLAGLSQPWVAGFEDALQSDAAEALPDALAAAISYPNAGATLDMSWTTTAAVLDLVALREQLKIDDPTLEQLPIPDSWYRNRIFVMDVVLERQQLQGDGEWSAIEKIDALPDLDVDPDKGDPNWRSTLRALVEGNPDYLSTVRKEEWLDWLETDPGHNQAAIIQPDFIETTGSYWTQPIEDEVKVGEDPGIGRLKGRITAAEFTRDKLQRQLDILENREDEERGGDGPGGDGGGALRPPGGGGGGSLQPPRGGGSGSGGDDPRVDPKEQKKERVRRKITGMEERIAALNTELIALAQQLGVNLNPEVKQVTIPDLGTDDQVLVWVHDPTVRVGETYRYRLTVRVYNPFFGRTAFLVPDQHELAVSPILEVQPSGWSTPAQVESHTRYFVTSANADDGQLGIGRAEFDVFRMYDGVWHQEEIRVHPGDPIGEVKRIKDQDENQIEVDFRTSAFVMDILRTPEKKGNSPGRTTKSRVVIVGADGSIIIRDPEADANDPERQELLLNAAADVRSARGG